jgi:hypothetical protein
MQGQQKGSERQQAVTGCEMVTQLSGQCNIQHSACLNMFRSSTRQYKVVQPHLVVPPPGLGVDRLSNRAQDAQAGAPAAHQDRPQTFQVSNTAGSSFGCCQRPKKAPTRRQVEGGNRRLGRLLCFAAHLCLVTCSSPQAMRVRMAVGAV